MLLHYRFPAVARPFLNSNPQFPFCLNLLLARYLFITMRKQQINYFFKGICGMHMENWGWWEFSCFSLPYSLRQDLSVKPTSLGYCLTSQLVLWGWNYRLASMPTQHELKSSDFHNKPFNLRVSSFTKYSTLRFTFCLLCFLSTVVWTRYFSMPSWSTLLRRRKSFCSFLFQNTNKWLRQADTYIKGSVNIEDTIINIWEGSWRCNKADFQKSKVGLETWLSG